MADLRKLFVAIGFKPDENSLKKVESGIGSIKKMMLATTAVASVAGAGLFGLAHSVAKIGDEARKTAQSLGLTTESLQELAFAADLGGVSQSDFFNSLRKLTRTAVEAGEGVATYKDEYDKLGISVHKADGSIKTSEQLLLDISEVFSKMPDSAEKTASAVALLGRSGARLIPLLNSGKEGIAATREEARLLGGVMSDETAKGNEEFIDSIARLKWFLRGVKIFVAAEVIPTFVELFTKIKDLGLANKELIQTKLAAFLRGTIKWMRFWFLIVSGIATRIGSLVRTLGGFEVVLGRVTKAVAAFLAVKFAIAVGLISQGVVGLIASLGTLKAGLISTQLAAVGLPLLIGAAVIALGFIIEDIIAFFQGRGSVTATLIDVFSKQFPAAFIVAHSAIANVVDILKVLWRWVKATIVILKGIFTFDIDMIAEGGAQILDIFDELVGNILNLFSGKLTEGIKSAVSFGVEKLRSLGEFFGISSTSGGSGGNVAQGANLAAPSTVPGVGPSISNRSSRGGDVRLDVAKVEVVVPPGTSADQAGATAEAIFADQMTTLLKQAAADVEPGVTL